MPACGLLALRLFHLGLETWPIIPMFHIRAIVDRAVEMRHSPVQLHQQASLPDWIPFQSVYTF